MSPFHLTTHLDQGILTIRVHGYLDGSGAEEVAEAVEHGFSQGCRKFVLNLAGAPVINSQGVALLFEMAENIVEHRGGQLVMVGLSKIAMTVFRNTGILSFAMVADTEAAAIAELS